MLCVALPNLALHLRIVEFAVVVELLQHGARQGVLVLFGELRRFLECLFEQFRQRVVSWDDYSAVGAGLP